MPRLDTTFESDFQYMATLHKSKPDQLIYVKGSTAYPQTVRSEAHRGTPWYLWTALRWSGQQRQWQSRGYAYWPLPKASTLTSTHWIILILIRVWFSSAARMIDPPRPEAIAPYACQSAGIQVKMITGDHKQRQIARMMELNQTDEVLAFTGQELSRMNSQELACCRSGCGFCPVAPEQNCAWSKPCTQR